MIFRTSSGLLTSICFAFWSSIFLPGPCSTGIASFGRFRGSVGLSGALISRLLGVLETLSCLAETVISGASWSRLRGSDDFEWFSLPESFFCGLNELTVFSRTDSCISGSDKLQEVDGSSDISKLSTISHSSFSSSSAGVVSVSFEARTSMKRLD